MWQVRQRQQKFITLCLSCRELGFQLLDAATASFVRREDCTWILTGLLGACHGLAGFILFALQTFHFRQETTTGSFELGQFRQVRSRVQTSTAQASVNGFWIVSNKGRVQHTIMLYRPVWPVGYDGRNATSCS